MIRQYYDPKAGPWVVWHDTTVTRNDGSTRVLRSYFWRDVAESGWHSFTTRASEGIRFDTRREADDYRKRWLGRSTPTRPNGVTRLDKEGNPT